MDFDPCQSGHDLFHLKNSYLSFYLAMKMRLGVTKRRLFGSWLVISAIWVAGVGYRTWRGFVGFGARASVTDASASSSKRKSCTTIAISTEYKPRLRCFHVPKRTRPETLSFVRF